MSASLQTVEDVVNYALDLIGYDRRIGDIYEGSRPSKVALDLYGQTRDELLRKNAPGFANRNVALTLQKSAPTGGYGSSAWAPSTNPPPPWLYQFAYPIDCLRLLYLEPTPSVIPVTNPLPLRYKIYNDQVAVPPDRVILANMSPLIAVYVGQVTDMTTWDPLFTELMGKALATKFIIALTKNQQLIDPVMKGSSAMEMMAEADAAGAEEN